MNGYELAALLRVKVTIANAMQAADKLEELEEKLKKKAGKKNESKSSGNEDQTSIPEQREVADNNGLAFDLPRTEVQPNFNEPLLSDAREMGYARTGRKWH